MEEWTPASIIAIVAVIGLVITAIGWVFGAGKLIAKVSSFEQNLKSFNKLLDEVRLDIKTIFARLRPAVESHSPITLTDFGKEISVSIDAKEWAKTEATRVIDRVKGQTEDEIQRFAFVYIEEEFLPNVTSAKLYNKVLEGSIKKNVSMEVVGRVMAVELRDALLAMSGDIRERSSTSLLLYV